MTTKSFIQKRSYEILLGSFLLLIFGNSFTPNLHVLASTVITLTMLTGFVVFFHRKHWGVFIGLLNIAHLLLATCFSQYEYIGNFALKHFVFQLYFWTAAILVFNKIFTVKKVSQEMIAAIICGFVILCLMGSFLFLQIELFHRHSFSNLPGGHRNLDELTYFSFLSMLTTGYGDITPLTLIAKRAVMLMGLTGHFYTVIVTSIIIGKYLGNQQRRTSLKQKSSPVDGHFVFQQAAAEEN